MVIIRYISLHISVNICREIFSFLKNRESLLACMLYVVVDAVNVFQTRGRCIFKARQKSIIVVSETRVSKKKKKKKKNNNNNNNNNNKNNSNNNKLILKRHRYNTSQNIE